MKKEYEGLRLIVLMAIMIVGFMFLPYHPSYAAATSVRVASVEYYEEQIIVLNNGNSKIYYATEKDAAKNIWDVITTDDGSYTMIDISWMSPSVENIIVIKGHEDPTKSRVIINKRPTKLEININYTNLDSMNDDATIAPLVNIMSSEGTGTKPINFDDLEWRKGTTGQWVSTRNLTVGLFKKLLVKGANLYFRIRALDDYVTITDASNNAIDLNEERILSLPGGIQNYDGPSYNLGTDYPDGTEGRRFSNEVKLRVVKQAPAMVFGIDGSKFTANIKAGKEYRVTVDGTTSKWVKVTDSTIKTLPLSTMINKTEIDGTTKDKAFPSMKIEIRNYATAKATSSNITEVQLNEQRKIENNIILDKAPATAVADGDANIYLYYNGDKNVVLTIPKASTTLPYEYCFVKKGDTLNISKAVWVSVTKGTDIKILASKALDGSTLYVRMKEIKSKEATSTTEAVGYKLASTYVSQTINYPSLPDITDAAYTYTKGYPTKITFAVKMNVKGKLAYESTISSIKLGTSNIDFTTTTTTVDEVITLTVTLKSDALASLPNSTLKTLTITYGNGFVDNTSIKLTIQNPVAAGTLTITNSTGTNAGSTSFTVVTAKAEGNSWAYVITPAAIANVYTVDKITNKTTATPTTFTSATVDNITVTANQYITIFELDSDGNIVKYKSIQITSAMIKP